jgi:hypothetical protein
MGLHTFTPAWPPKALIERFTELFQDKLEEKELEEKEKVLRQAAAIAQIMERVERRLSPASKSS